MAGRIRSIKPEVLDDEPMSQLSDGAWRLYISSWVMADDHGRFRAGARLLAAEGWQDTSKTDHAEAMLQELRDKGFVRAYMVEGQRYAEIKPRGWAKHQRIDHPGKPRVPVPSEFDYLDAVSRTASEPLGEPRPSRARGGPPTSDLRPPTSDHDAREGSDEPTEPPPPESVEPEAPAPAKQPEGPYDLARRVFDDEWARCHRRPYAWDPRTGKGSDDAAMVDAGRYAVERGAERAELFMRHWAKAYVTDPDKFFASNGHPARFLTRTAANKYGEPKPPASVTRIAKAKPPEPTPLSKEEHLAVLERARKLARGIGDIAPKKESAG